MAWPFHRSRQALQAATLAWKGRNARQIVVSFEAFVTHKLWWGLESSIDELRIYCRKHPDRLQ